MPAIGSTTLEQVAGTFSKFLDDIALLENDVGKMIPSLIVWDLNGIPANLLTGGEEPLQTRLCQQLHLMKDLLAARPQYTWGSSLSAGHLHQGAWQGVPSTLRSILTWKPRALTATQTWL